MKMEEDVLVDDEPEFESQFDARMIDEYDEIYETDEMPFYDMYHRMERERSFGRDGFYE